LGRGFKSIINLQCSIDNRTLKIEDRRCDFREETLLRVSPATGGEAGRGNLAFSQPPRQAAPATPPLEGNLRRIVINKMHWNFNACKKVSLPAHAGNPGEKLIEKWGDWRADDNIPKNYLFYYLYKYL